MRGVSPSRRGRARCGRAGEGRAASFLGAVYDKKKRPRPCGRARGRRGGESHHTTTGGRGRGVCPNFSFPGWTGRPTTHTLAQRAGRGAAGPPPPLPISLSHQCLIFSLLLSSVVPCGNWSSCTCCRTAGTPTPPAWTPARVGERERWAKSEVRGEGGGGRVTAPLSPLLSLSVSRPKPRTSATCWPYRLDRQRGHQNMGHCVHLAFISTVFWRHCVEWCSVGGEKRG